MLHKISTLSVAAVLFSAATAYGYEASEQTEAFVEQLVTQDGFQRADVEAWLQAAQKQPRILEAIARPAEKVLTWKDYQDIFLTKKRVDEGREFWERNHQALADSERKFGVPAEIITAIIGVETSYGAIKGKYRVIDALSTLAFDYPPRSPFFTRELREFFLLAREQKVDPTSLTGSYAGAMGYGQFMPSSYRQYAADYDGDGHIDIWNDAGDAIASVASYLNMHGWQAGKPIVIPVDNVNALDRSLLLKDLKPQQHIGELRSQGVTLDLPDVDLSPDAPVSLFELQGKQGAELWLGLTNFYAITRYNHSRLYAMAVFQLGQQIKQSPGRENHEG